CPCLPNTAAPGCGTRPPPRGGCGCFPLPGGRGGTGGGRGSSVASVGADSAGRYPGADPYAPAGWTTHRIRDGEYSAAVRGSEISAEHKPITTSRFSRA